MLLFILIGILIVSFGASFRFKSERRSLVKPFKFIFWGCVVLFFIFLFYETRQQFLVWQNNSPSAYFLPPYRDIGYFLGYCFYVFLAKPTVALLSAIIFLYSAKFFNRKFGERFFEEEEPYFGALSIFLVGYPGLIFYLIITLVSGLVGAVITKQRFSAYYLWFPIAIFVIIIINIWLKDLSIWRALKF